MDATTNKTAKALKALIAESSPLIEQYTRQVCPNCADVCCRQKHGMFTSADRAYLTALGEHVPPHDLSRASDAFCQFLGAGGCTKPRWQRAWKCTWYFCDPLLQAVADGPQRQARSLSRMQAEIQRLYEELNGGGDV